MQSEPTTYEETIIKNYATLPSITFCVDAYEDNFVTFQARDLRFFMEVHNKPAKNIFRKEDLKK